MGDVTVFDTNSKTNESDKISELSTKLEETKSELEQLTSTENYLMNEDIIVQEKEWLAKRMEEQREEENRIREELFEKQRMLEEMRKEQSEFAIQSKQMKIYNQMHEEEQRDQVYSIHGVSVDKFQGMKEYKNALYQGAQIVLLLIDLVLCVGAAYLYGYISAMFFVFAALFATRISLLPREHGGELKTTPYSIVSQVFSFIPTPLMIVALVAKETNVIPVDTVLTICSIAILALAVFGGLDYYSRNPYRAERGACRAAKTDLKILKRKAAKTVKKNIKLRQKVEAQLLRRKERQENKLVKAKEKEEIRFAKKQKIEEERALKLKDKLKQEEEKQAKARELAVIRDANRVKRKELVDKKIIDFKSKMNLLLQKKKEEKEVVEEISDTEKDKITG